jgi:hypothetical protein
LDLDEDSGGLRRERIGVEQIRFEDVGGWSQFHNKITFIPQLKGHVLTPKFGKESDLWVQLGESDFVPGMPSLDLRLVRVNQDPLPALIPLEGTKRRTREGE